MEQWKEAVFYQIYPCSFKDSGDSICLHADQGECSPQGSAASPWNIPGGCEPQPAEMVCALQ